MAGELGFTGPGESPDEQCSPVRADFEGPDCGLILSGDLVYKAIFIRGNAISINSYIG